MFIDVIWPAVYTDLLAPLDPHLTPGFTSQFDPGHMAASTVGGKIYALPHAGNVAGLYYRQDLLIKYNFNGPPKTWAELENMMTVILPAEKNSGNTKLWGYIGQFAPYEGLTCNLMELLGTAGGMIEPDGSLSIVKDPSKRQTVLNAMTMLRRWFALGYIPPNGLLAREDQGRKLFQSGEMLFMRNWFVRPWLSISEGTAAIAPMPAWSADTPGYATNGAKYLGVNKKTKNMTRAVQALEYLTSEDQSWWWARAMGQLPTQKHLLQSTISSQHTPTAAMISRPSAQTGAKYPQVSAILYTHWHNMLAGLYGPEQAIEKLTWDLADLLNINLLGAPLLVEWTSPVGISVSILHVIAQAFLVHVALPLLRGRKQWSREQRRASPPLILALLFGLFIFNTWSLVFLGEQFPLTCALRPVIPGLAWALVLAIMAVQDLQVYLIMWSPLRTVAMTVNKQLRIFLAGSQLLQWLLTGVYLLLSRPMPRIVKIGRQFQYVGCMLDSTAHVDGGGELASLALVMVAVLMFLNVWLAARMSMVSNLKAMHRVPIIRVVYLILMLALIAILMAALDSLNPTVRALIASGVTLIHTIGVTRLYVLPRLAPSGSSTSLAWMGDTHAAGGGVSAAKVLPHRLGSSIRNSRGGPSSIASESSREMSLAKLSDAFVCRVANSERRLELLPMLPCLLTVMRDSSVLVIVERGEGTPRFRHVVNLANELESVKATAQQACKGQVTQSLKLVFRNKLRIELACSGQVGTVVSALIGEWKSELGDYVEAAEPSSGSETRRAETGARPSHVSTMGAVTTVVTQANA
ncbi:hypothetical protein BCR44DRAFT_73350 [Catenaria anguillulae PL171]|uniref:G-protein coupled receptors family 3 profile domain-containing protein n=1 Tax=Catenaria anguillulae PL171 TaxID=765915 RepID=A0A1Y2HS95_9FUNG|nr:hypothetical protein BCR44DRAFT_73350 [Catenaria anguillulae PL171]